MKENNLPKTLVLFEKLLLHPGGFSQGYLFINLLLTPTFHHNISFFERDNLV